MLPQPSHDALRLEYADYYQRRGGGLAGRRKTAHFSRLFEQYLPTVRAKSVLDIGAAEGDATAAILSLDPTARIEMVENNPESAGLLAELATADGVRHELISAEDAVTVQRPHDVVLAFDLMEHLREPRSWLQQLSEHRLAAGSLLIATFPNFDSLSRRALGPLWPQRKLEHLHYFSRDGVGALGQAAGLESVELRPLTKYLPIAYLLDVGSAFGPPPARALVRGLRAVTPRTIRARTTSVRLGEWLWIARKT